MLEKKLHEELMRYNQINKYANKMISEQEELPAEEPLPGDEELPGDELPAEEPLPGDEELPADDMGGDTEEIDITDLVNMTKSIKKDLEQKTNDSDGVLNKMDDIFTKLGDLEKRISEMDEIMVKIDSLGEKIERVKEPTPEEKLELRSLDSYPFNKSPKDFFDDKIPEMEKSHKNEYIITPDDASDYSKETIRNTFNKDAEEDEYRF